MSYAKRKDASHNSIVDGLEAAGKIVFDVSKAPGLGFDIIIYDPSIVFEIGAHVYEGIWIPMELKTPKPKTRAYRSNSRALRKGPQFTASELRARTRAPIASAETIAEALSYFRDSS